MEGSDNEFVKFKVPALKAFLKARSQSVSGNKKKLAARAKGLQGGSGSCDLSRLLSRKFTKGIHSRKPAPLICSSRPQFKILNFCFSSCSFNFHVLAYLKKLGIHSRGWSVVNLRIWKQCDLFYNILLARKLY